MKNVVTLFLRLVQIDSPSGQESEMITFLETWLEKNNFKYKKDSVGNLYAKRGFKDTTILFCAHMDTVEPGKGVKPVIKGGFIKSSKETILGADNKAFIATLLTAVEKCDKEKSIELIFSVKEETGGGIEHFPFQWIKSKTAFIFDSANPVGGIVLKSPYICNFHMTFKGKATHASTPKKGINAFISALPVLNKIPVGEIDDGQTTMNVGLINGGTSINTVPDKIVVSGEIRSYDKKLFDKHMKEIKALCDNTVFDGFCPGYIHEQNNLITKKIETIYQNMHLKPIFCEKSGISDANILNSRGVQTFNLTDGVKNPHTTEEKISIHSLEQITEIVSAILRSFRQ